MDKARNRIKINGIRNTKYGIQNDRILNDEIRNIDIFINEEKINLKTKYRITEYGIQNDKIRNME